jgi:hypothetical protein
MTEFFNRAGEPVENPYEIKGAAGLEAGYYDFRASCTRCGGAGGGTQWSHTGFTCFECRGAKTFAKTGRCYTAAKLAKLNASQAKRQAKREAKRQAVVDKFDGDHAELLAALAPILADTRVSTGARRMFVEDVLRKGRQFGRLSDKQLAALRAVPAKEAARAEREAQRQVEAAKSDYVGEVGQRLELTVTVEHKAEIDHGPHAQFSRYFYITTMVDDQANCVVIKSSTFCQYEPGDRLTMKATVKAHDEYHGRKQTVVQRPKVTSGRIVERCEEISCAWEPSDPAVVPADYTGISGKTDGLATHLKNAGGN